MADNEYGMKKNKNPEVWMYVILGTLEKSNIGL